MAKTPSSDAAASVTDDAVATPPTKGHATPTRKEQEAARKQPLVPSDRRLAAKQSRAQQTTARERARVGMANGEEKFLPAKDKGPQKKYVRDYIDARFSIGEVLLPMLALVILSYFLPLQYQQYALYVAYAFIIIVIIDAVILGQILTRKLGEKFGKTKVEKVRWYAFMRVIQMRPLRLPKPQVKRGQYPA
ncbi:hypothetical protein BH11ACT3_BH11ACT3_21550 [soil metagenome]